MTLDAIARFADSASGRTYLATCQTFGVDPAAGIEDPFMAYQLRGALLAMAGAESAVEPSQEELPGKLSDGTPWPS